MKCFYLVLFEIFFAGQLTNTLTAQSNSVVLIPTTGSSQSFASITSAYGAVPLNLPSGNNYMIELLPAYDGTDPSEIYPIQLTNKFLPAGGATITIRPALGNMGETIQRPIPVAGNLIEINGGTNIMIDGRPGGVVSSPANYLNVVDVFSRANNSNILLINGACNNKIEYINASAIPGDTYLGNRILNIHTSPLGYPNNYNLISNNIITGGQRGVQIAGTVAVNTGNIISFNIIKDFAFAGVFGSPNFHDSTYVSNNTITCSAIYYVPSNTGIFFQGEVTLTNIIANTITSDIPKSNIAGIVGIQVTHQPGSTGSANILNNVITDLTSPGADIVNGISVSPSGIFIIKNNIISNLFSPFGSATGIGSGPYDPGSTLIVSNNQISALKSNGNRTASVTGISIYPYPGNCINNLFNNFISITNTNQAAVISGIKILESNLTPTSSYATNIFFNSIRIGGQSLGGANGIQCAGIYKMDNYAGSIYTQKNNVCIIDRTGNSPGIIFSGFVLSNTSGILDIDYNTYYGSSDFASSYSGYWVNTPYNKLQQTNYRVAAIPNEQHSNFANVLFQSNTDLHLAGSSLTNLGLTGVPIDKINFDIDNDPRKSSLPTRGADENTVTSIITNVKAGLWSDISVWSNNAVPQLSDKVLLNYDITIDINASCKLLYVNEHNVNVNPNIILTIAP
ncbi:MAG: hypothetical protein JWP81_3298 [Ferruginibacter sp.]|nr:hypothetical protein [Ferruginibacter sp.]